MVRERALWHTSLLSYVSSASGRACSWGRFGCVFAVMLGVSLMARRGCACLCRAAAGVLSPACLRVGLVVCPASWRSVSAVRVCVFDKCVWGARLYTDPAVEGCLWTPRRVVCWRSAIVVSFSWECCLGFCLREGACLAGSLCGRLCGLGCGGVVCAGWVSRVCSWWVACCGWEPGAAGVREWAVLVAARWVASACCCEWAARVRGEGARVGLVCGGLVTLAGRTRRLYLSCVVWYYIVARRESSRGDRRLKLLPKRDNDSFSPWTLSSPHISVMFAILILFFKLHSSSPLF